MAPGPRLIWQSESSPEVFLREVVETLTGFLRKDSESRTVKTGETLPERQWYSAPVRRGRAEDRMPKSLPKSKRTKDEVLAELRGLRSEDAQWKEGRTFSLVYYVDDEHSRLLKEAYGEFMAENGLSPMAFPSLRRMEAEVVVHGRASSSTAMTTWPAR